MTSPKVTVIDYGMGNLRSVAKALEFVGCRVQVSGDPAVIESAQRVVFPGVGAFGDGMKNVRSMGMEVAIQKFLGTGRPFLGICLGFQVLFETSEEFGSQTGLGVFKGNVRGFVPKAGIKIPHMGWNHLHVLESARQQHLWRDIPASAAVYFAHSFHVVPSDSKIVAAQCSHGEEFVAAVQDRNILGVQFHPEKSQAIGLQIFRNFSSWEPEL